MSASVGAVLAIGVLLGMSTAAAAATFGSDLTAPVNGSLCTFESKEPEIDICTVGQSNYWMNPSPKNVAPDGLVAPFDGVIVRWSVTSGVAPPGTGTVKLALRTMKGPGYIEKGPQVELPASPPGTLHTFAERMPISARQPIGLKISVANRNTQEAGAPIAFREEGAGVIDIWSDEPLESVWKTEDDVELMLSAEIEPDIDKDGYGDLTQDCFPAIAGSQELCGRDLMAPAIWPRFAVRQAFLRSGVILVQVASNETALVRAEGHLEIKGRGVSSFPLPSARKAVTPDRLAMLRLRVPKRVLKRARAAVRSGKKAVATVRMSVADAAGNERQRVGRVRPRLMELQDSP